MDCSFPHTPTPCNLTKISLLFVPITAASENPMTRMKENSLLASLGFPCHVTSSWLVDFLWKVYFL